MNLVFPDNNLPVPEANPVVPDGDQPEDPVIPDEVAPNVPEPVLNPVHLAAPVVRAPVVRAPAPLPLLAGQPAHPAPPIQPPGPVVIRFRRAPIVNPDRAPIVNPDRAPAPPALPPRAPGQALLAAAPPNQPPNG